MNTLSNFKETNLGNNSPEPLTDSLVFVSLNAIKEKEIEKTNIKIHKNILLFFININIIYQIN